MSKRIVPVVTVTVCLIIKLVGNWNGEIAVGLFDDVIKNGDFQNTNVNHWRPVLSRCEEYLKEKFEGNIEDFREAEEMVTLETRERVLVILRFLTKVVENVKDASTYPFRLGWPLMNLSYCFDLEVATQASFLLSEICSDRMKIELLFEGSPPSYDEFIGPLVEIGSSSIQSFDWRPRETRRVYDFYKCIQNLRVGDCSEADIDERLVQIKYDMKRIMMNYQDEFSGVSSCEEINESSKLEEHLDLLKNETVSLQLKSGVLRYVRTLFECIFSSDVGLINDSKCFMDNFVLPLWEAAISNTVPIGLLQEIMNLLEYFAVNAPHNLNPLQLITSFLDFVVNNLEGASFCKEQKRSEVLKCFIKILEQRCLKEEEIDVILERTVEIVSLLHQGRESLMKCFGVYLEVVECFLRKPNHMEKVPIDTLVCYKNILVFVVNNPKKFPMDVHVSVVKGLGTLNNVRIPENLEDSSDARRCPECRGNYMGLLAMMLDEDAGSNPCLAGEVLHSIAEILKNECHEVEMQDLGLHPYKLKELCCTFIGSGMYLSENHFMQNLVNVLNLNPNFDKNKCTLSFIMDLLEECIDEEYNKEVVLSDLQPEAQIWFDDMLFPECNFDEEICMLLGLLSHYLDGITRESGACALYSSRLVGIIFYSKLSYKFHQNSSEFTYLLKSACQYFNRNPKDYERFIRKYFSKVQKLSRKIKGRSKLGDRPRISFVITLMRTFDVLFIDDCDPRKKIRDGMDLGKDLWWETLKAAVEIRDFILSLYDQDLTSPQTTFSQYTQNHLSKFILPLEFVDNSFWSLRDIDNNVGHIDRTIGLLFQLQLVIFDRMMLQGSFLSQGGLLGVDFEKLRRSVILSIIDEVKKALKLREERGATCIERISWMGSILGRILNMTGDRRLGALFFNIGVNDEVCEILLETNERKEAKITFSGLKDQLFCTKTPIEIKTSHLSKILHFYYSLFGEIKVGGVGNKDIAGNLMIFLKYVSKSKMDINDACIFVKLVDMSYCMIDGIGSLKYSEFTNAIDRLSLFETKLTAIDSVLDIKDGCLKDVDNLFKCSGEFSENVTQDSIQKVSTVGFYHVRYKINNFIDKLGRIGGVEIDTSSLIELISNNFLIYSFLNPCECRGDCRGECTSHYDKGRVIEFIGCLDKYLSDSTLEIILKSYSSLLRLSEIDEGLVSKVEIFERFPLRKLLLLISSSKESSSVFKPFNVVIEQFLESKECVRRLINNELLINRNGLDIDNVEVVVDMQKSLAFRNMEIFVECIRNKKKSAIARRDQSGDKLCREVVEKVIGCIDGGSGFGVLSLRLLTEIILNRPCLSVLCEEDKGFIENMVWRFIEADCEEKSIWERCFINVIFTRTNNLKLKRMIFNSIILKMKTGGGSSLKNGFSLLLDIFNYKVHVEKYNFSENFVRDRRGTDGHNCNGYCEVESIFRQNADILSDRQLFDLVINEHGGCVPMGSDSATKLALLLKTLLLLHLRKMAHSNGNGTNEVNEEMVLSYLRDFKKEGEILSSELCNPKLYNNHEGDGGMPDGSPNGKVWERFGSFGPSCSAGLESSLSRWRIGEGMMRGSIDLAYFVQSYMEGYRSLADEGNASTINPRGRDILISEDRHGRRPISCDVDQDIPALEMEYYFNEWIDKEKNKVMKMLWGNGPDHFRGILPPVSPKAYVNIARLMYFGDGDEEILTGLCEALSSLPLDRRIQHAFFEMVVRPLYQLGACFQGDINTLFNVSSIRKGLKLISGFVMLDCSYKACFLMDTRLVYSLYLCHNEMPISRDLIGEISSYKVKIDEVSVDFKKDTDLSWMDDISKDLTTLSINGFDSMISKGCPVVGLLSDHEKLWLETLISFINKSEFENSVAYVLKVILLSKVVPITVYTFIFFDVFISKLERLIMNHGCGCNEYSTLRNVFRGLVLLFSLDRGGLSSNLKDYYHEELGKKDPAEMLEMITLYFQKRFGGVLSVDAWKMIFSSLEKRNVVLESADFLCVFEVFCGVSVLRFEERVSELAGWYCDVYGLRWNQTKRDNDGVILFNLNEPSGVRRGLVDCGDKDFGEYSTTFIIDRLSRLLELESTEFSRFLYSRSVGPTFPLRKRHFYGIIKKEFQGRESYTLEVNRGNLLCSSYKEIMNIGKRSQSGNFNFKIEFKGEQGIDVGGLSKEWFFILGEKMMEFKGMLFAEADDPGMRGDDKDAAHGSNDCLEHFDRFVGRVMGLAVLHGKCMGLSFPLVVYRFLLFDECNVRDMMDLDPVFFKSIFNLRKGGDPKFLYLTFTFTGRVNGRVETGVPMKENGENIEVIEGNLEEYIEKSVRFKVIYGRREQMEELRLGFWEIVDIPELKMFFTAEELKELIEGSKAIDLDDWKKHSVFEDFGDEEAKYRKWFWDAVESLSEDQRRKLLGFVTGSSKVPVGGFSQLSRFFGGRPPFIIKKHSKKVEKGYLPIAHTCFNIIELPGCESYEELREKLVKIAAHSRGFGLI